MARKAGRWTLMLLACLMMVRMASAPAARAQAAEGSLCKLLPVDSIEKLLGAKATKPLGMDILPGVGNCSVDAPDPKHMVILSTASLVGQAGRNIEERTKLGLKLMESSKGPKPKATYQYMGDVVCSIEELAPPFKQTICMTDRGQRQFNLLVRSDNPGHVRVDAVKQLLKETVAKAK
jgi:hypothetical protein